MKLDQEKPLLKETKVSAQIRSAFDYDKTCRGLHQIRCMHADFIKRHEVYSHPSPLLSARNAVLKSARPPNYTIFFFIYIYP